jgi:signal transduction histidine kinase
MFRGCLSLLGLALAYIALGWLCHRVGLWTPIEVEAEAEHALATSGLPVGLPLGLALAWVLVRGGSALPGLPLGVLGLHLLIHAAQGGLALDAGFRAVTLIGACVATGLVAVATLVLRRLGLHRSSLADLRSAGLLLGLLALLSAAQALLSMQWLGLHGQWSELARHDYAWRAFAGTFAGLVAVVPAVLIARHPAARSLARARWVGITSVVVVVLSLTLSASYHGSDAALAQSEFAAQGEAAARALLRELEVTETLLRGLASYVEATPQVSARGFETMSQQLHLQANAVQAVSWNPVVTREQRAGFERAATQDRAHPFGILERDASGQLVRAGDRPRHTVVQLIAPLGANRKALGYDIASDPTLRSALEAAELSGQITSTGRLRLVQESGHSWGLLVLLAVDHPPVATGQSTRAGQGTRGFATLVLRIEDLARGALMAAHPGTVVGLDPAPIRYRLVDATASPGQGELFDSGDGTDSSAEAVGGPVWMARPPLHHAVELPFASRSLRLLAETTPAFWESRPESQIHALDLWLATLQALGVLLTLLVTGQRQHLRTTLDDRTLALRQAQSQLQRQSEQLRAVVAASREGFATFDQALHLSSHNDRMARACGLDGHALSRLDARQLLDRLIERHQAADATPAPAALCGPVTPGTEGDLTLDLAEHERGRHVRVSVQPLNAPGLSLVVLLHDVTDFEQLSRAKSQFLATAAHEIRTPMTLVHGYAHLLADLPDMPPRQRSGVVDKMLAATGAVNRLVNGLVHCAHLDTPGAVVLHPQPLDLGPWLAGACSAWPLPEGRGPLLLPPGPTPALALADPDALQEVLSELLHNAHEFSPAGTPVTVRWRPASALDGIETPADGWVVEVRNEGTGIEPAHLPQVFDRFFRADTSGARPGFGLGLGMARATLRLMGGDLSLHSRPGQGAVARIHLAAAAGL